MIAFLFSACIYSPFENYWAQEDQFPQITAISPQSISTRVGGQEIDITGSQLGNTKTVVVGGRNADIISVSDTSVRIVLPPQSGGDATSELSLITTEGYVRIEDGITYTSFGTDWWDKEQGSFSLLTLDCPIEAYGLSGQDYYPLFWCALEMGSSSVSGNIGSQLEPGFAGEMSGLTPLSSIPELDTAQLWKQEPLGIPTRYGSFQEGDTIHIETPRNLSQDLEAIQEKMELFQENYYWIEDVQNIQLHAVLLDDDACYLLDADDFSNTDSTLTLSQDVSNAGYLWLGYSATELYDGEAYFYEGFTSTASVQEIQSNNGETEILPSPAGVQLSFSNYSGIFFADERGMELGNRDIPFDAPYTIRLHTKGTEELIGTVQGATAFDLTWPYLIGGQEQISKSNGYLFEWNPAENTSDPSIVVAEIRIYDMSVQDPNGWYEVARLVKATEDSTGWLEFTSEELDELPFASNEIDDDYNLIGLWGEVTIARHQLRKAPYHDNTWVLDFVHAIQSPIDVVE